MANFLSKLIPNFVAKFAANPSDKSLFFFEPNRSQFKSYRKHTNIDYQAILCDDEISAALDTRLDNILSMPWALSGGDDDKNLLIWEQINRHFYSLVSNAWWAVYFGKAAFQVVYARDGSEIIIDQVIDEDYQQFQLVKGVWMHNNKSFAEGKYFITVNKPSAYRPEGTGLADKLYDICYLRKDGWQFYMKYLEKFGVPFFALTLAENTSVEDRAAMVTFLQSERPRGVTLPNGVKMDTIDGRTSSIGVFDSFETIMRERIQRLILGQTLTSGTGDSGSYALGQVHERVAANKTFSDSVMIQKTMNAVVTVLFELNKMTGDIPTFAFSSPKGIQKDLADRDAVLKDIGVTFSKEYFVDEYELDAEQINYTPAPVGGGAPSQFTKLTAGKVRKEFITQDALKLRASIAEKLEDKYIQESPNLGTDIAKILKKAKTRDELEKMLRSFLRKDTPEFDEALTEAMLNSSILGNKNVEKV